MPLLKRNTIYNSSHNKENIPPGYSGTVPSTSRFFKENPSTSTVLTRAPPIVTQSFNSDEDFIFRKPDTCDSLNDSGIECPSPQVSKNSVSTTINFCSDTFDETFLSPNMTPALPGNRFNTVKQIVDQSPRQTANEEDARTPAPYKKCSLSQNLHGNKQFSLRDTPNPKQRDQTSKQRDQTSKQRDQTSKQRDQTSKQRDQTHKQGGQIPKQRNQTSKQRDQTFKQRVQTPSPGDQTPKQTEQTPKQTGQYSQTAPSLDFSNNSIIPNTQEICENIKPIENLNIDKKKLLGEKWKSTSDLDNTGGISKTKGSRFPGRKFNSLKSIELKDQKSVHGDSKKSKVSRDPKMKICQKIFFDFQQSQMTYSQRSSDFILKDVIYQRDLEEQRRPNLPAPPPNCTYHQRLEWLQKERFVGVYVSCDKCDKFRYLEHVYDPLDIPDMWYCHMNPDKNYNKCEIPEKKLSDNIVAQFIENCYNAGSIVWAKRRGYPWWPAIIDDCPYAEQYFWVKFKCDKPIGYNVTYFDIELTTSWLEVDYIIDFKKHQPSLDGEYAKRLSKAIKQANAAQQMSLPDRLKKYSFLACYSWENYAMEKDKVCIEMFKSLYQDNYELQGNSEIQKNDERDVAQMKDSKRKNNKKCTSQTKNRRTDELKETELKQTQELKQIEKLKQTKEFKRTVLKQTEELNQTEDLKQAEESKTSLSKISEGKSPVVPKIKRKRGMKTCSKYLAKNIICSGSSDSNSEPYFFQKRKFLSQGMPQPGLKLTPLTPVSASQPLVSNGSSEFDKLMQSFAEQFSQSISESSLYPNINTQDCLNLFSQDIL